MTTGNVRGTSTLKSGLRVPYIQICDGPFDAPGTTVRTLTATTDDIAGGGSLLSGTTQVIEGDATATIGATVIVDNGGGAVEVTLPLIDGDAASNGDAVLVVVQEDTDPNAVTIAATGPNLAVGDTGSFLQGDTILCVALVADGVSVWVCAKLTAFAGGADTNLGNTDLTLSGGRQVDCDGNDLTFLGNGHRILRSTDGDDVGELDVDHARVTLKRQTGDATELCQIEMETAGFTAQCREFFVQPVEAGTGAQLTLTDEDQSANVRLRAPAAINTAYDFLFPDDQPAASQVVRQNAANSGLEWVDASRPVPGADITASGGAVTNRSHVVDSSGGAVTIDLPEANDVAAQAHDTITFLVVDASNTIDFAASGSDSVDQPGAVPVGVYRAFCMTSSGGGGSWRVVAL